LAYNTLKFEADSKDLGASEDMLMALYDIVVKSITLIHLDVSGMNLGRDQVKFLTEGAA